MIIFVEGIDKTGKDTLAYYLNQYTDFGHYVSARGPLSTLVYAEKFKRKCDSFDYLIRIKNEILIVLLTSEEKDLDIRFKMTDEPWIDICQDMRLFEKQYFKFQQLGIHCVKYNTSYMTPTQIAMSIQHYLSEIEKRKHEKQ